MSLASGHCLRAALPALLLLSECFSISVSALPAEGRLSIFSFRDQGSGAPQGQMRRNSPPVRKSGLVQSEIRRDAQPKSLNPTLLPVENAPSAADPTPAFGVNEMRLSLRQWLIAAAIVLLLMALAPRAWTACRAVRKPGQTTEFPTLLAPITGFTSGEQTQSHCQILFP